MRKKIGSHFLTAGARPLAGFSIPAFYHEVFEPGQSCNPCAVSGDVIKRWTIPQRDAKLHYGGTCVFKDIGHGEMFCVVAFRVGRFFDWDSQKSVREHNHKDLIQKWIFQVILQGSRVEMEAWHWSDLLLVRQIAHCLLTLTVMGGRTHRESMLCCPISKA